MAIRRMAFGGHKLCEMYSLDTIQSLRFTRHLECLVVAIRYCLPDAVYQTLGSLLLENGHQECSLKIVYPTECLDGVRSDDV